MAKKCEAAEKAFWIFSTGNKGKGKFPQKKTKQFKNYKKRDD